MSWFVEEREVGFELDENGIQLSFDEVVMLVFLNNLGLCVECFCWVQDFFCIQQQEGVYDFGIVFNVGFDELMMVVVMIFVGVDVVQVENQNFNLQLRQLISIGGEFGIDYNNCWFELNLQFQFFNLLFNINFDVVYNQLILCDVGCFVMEWGI